MAELRSETNVAVVGAGAAGIGAARRLLDAGSLSVVVLEARNRVGGRVHTIAPAGFPLDRGAEWLHSADRNPLSSIAERLGFSIHRRPPEWTSRLRHSGVAVEAEADWRATREAQARARRAAAAEPVDRPLSSLLVPGGRWNELLDATSTWGNGAELDRVSVKDYVRYEESGTNWRLREGYGRFFETLAKDLPVELDAAVSRIDHTGRSIRLETARGTVTSSRVIVTVPSSIIAAERLRFEPTLPEKVEAAASLPLGVDDKLFISLSGQLPGVEGGAYLIGSTTSRQTMSYQVRPFGRPAIYCFFGGRFAAALEREGEGAMFSFAAGELVRLFGSDVRRQLTPLASSAWLADPWARGSYSYALPGHADNRAALAAAVDDRLFFAGEATSPNFFSTAHGAYISGLTAAEAALASLRRWKSGVDSREAAAAN